jgi:protein SCO1/2
MSALSFHRPRRRIGAVRPALLLAVLVGATGCAGSAPAAESRAHDDAAAPAAAARDDYSIYELGSAWRDQTGHTRTLDSFRGRPQLVAMVYTHCSTSCPITIDQMKRIAQAVPELGLVLVSLDPQRDSTVQLAEYAHTRGLDPSRWTLLTGRSDDVRELAALLGIRYRRLSPEELAHSNTLTLLDASGAPVHQGWGPASERDITDRARRLAR